MVARGSRGVRTKEQAAHQARFVSTFNYELRKDVREVLKTTHGRRLMHRILDQTGVDDPTPRGHATEAWISVGQRDIGLGVLELMEGLKNVGALRDEMRNDYALLEARCLEESADEPDEDDAGHEPQTP